MANKNRKEAVAVAEKVAFVPVKFDEATTAAIRSEILAKLEGLVARAKVSVKVEESDDATDSGYVSLGFSVDLGIADGDFEKIVKEALGSRQVAVEDFAVTAPFVAVDLVYRNEAGAPVPSMQTLWIERAKDYEGVNPEWLGRKYHVPDPDDDLDPQYPYEFTVVGLRTTAKKTPIAVQCTDPLGNGAIEFYGAKDLEGLLAAAGDRKKAEATWKSSMKPAHVKLVEEARVKAKEIGADAAWEEVYAKWEAATEKQSAAA